MTIEPAIKRPMPVNTPTAPIGRADSSRQPTYTGSRRMSEKGFNSARRRLTDSHWGPCAASSRPLEAASEAHGPAQRFHSLEFHELRRGRPQIVTVEERLECGRAIHRQGADFGICTRFVEEWDGHALAAHAGDEMFGC